MLDVSSSQEITTYNPGTFWMLSSVLSVPASMIRTECPARARRALWMRWQCQHSEASLEFPLSCLPKCASTRTGTNDNIFVRLRQRRDYTSTSCSDERKECGEPHLSELGTQARDRSEETDAWSTLRLYTRPRG